MNNKYIFILFMAVIIAITVTLFLFPEQSVEKTNKPLSKINVVSQVDEKKPQTFEFDQKKWQKQHDEKMTQYEQFWQSFLHGKEVKQMNSKPTYLEAYRDYIYYEGCLAIIGNVLTGQDPFLYTLNRNQAFADVTLAQQQALEKRLNKCIQLSDFSERNYSADVAKSQLRKRYDAINPKTANEQQLAKALNLLEEFNFTSNRLKSAERGENIDHQLFIDLMKQKRGLEDHMPKPATLFGGFSESDQIIVDQLNGQIAEVEQRIADNKHKDNAEVAALKAEIKRLIDELQVVVIDTQSSDAYLAVYDLIKDEARDVNMQAIKAQFTGGIELIPKKYETYLTPSLVHFRACELMHPCAQDSLLVEQQCLNFRNENAALACNSELIDYYLSHYLSPNQMLDVEYIITEGY